MVWITRVTGLRKTSMASRRVSVVWMLYLWFKKGGPQYPVVLGASACFSLGTAAAL